MSKQEMQTVIDTEVADSKPANLPKPFKKPIFIIAGGCSEEVSAELQGRYGDLVREAFRGFDGTVISGGTIQGVSGIAGSLAEGSQIELVAYLPEHLHKDATKDERYHRFETSGGQHFGPLEPLCYWQDIVQSGIKAEEVKLLGIGGGEISAFEYRLALALGAKVAVIPGSGGAADGILEDDDWASDSNLIHLPVTKHGEEPATWEVDRITLREFIAYPLS